MQLYPDPLITKTERAPPPQGESMTYRDTTRVEGRESVAAPVQIPVQAPDVGMIPVEKAAADLGISPAKLRGHILRNKVTDPVGNLHWVYEDTLGPLRKRLPDSASGALE